MPPLMFQASTDFFEKFTRANDFAQVCAASVWTMRWQVKGFFAEAGYYESPQMKPSHSDLKARFLAGSGLTRANFRSLVDTQSWARQRRILAEMTLLTVTSLFEGWCDAIRDEARLTRAGGDAIQWPSHSSYPRFNSRGRPMLGIGDTLTQARAKISPVMTDCFYPTYATGRQYSLTHIDNLLICYRYWKEARNSVAHAGGRATAKLIAEDSRLTALTPASLGVSRVPRLGPVTIGDQIELELESVLGFGEILHRTA